MIVLCGPIASGKSSLAISVACAFREQAFGAATIDLDVIYEMLSDPHAAKTDGTVWTQARKTAGALTKALLQDGVHIVIAEGDFLDEPARCEFLSTLPNNVSIRFVTLSVPLATALLRVGQDPTRGISRDRAFLTQHYATLSEAMRHRPVADLCLDTSAVTLEEATQSVVEWALTPASPTLSGLEPNDRSREAGTTGM